MSNAPVFPTGGYLSGNRYSSHADVASPRTAIPRVDEAGASGHRKVRGGLRMDPTDPTADEPHYPAWKVTLFVIVFCGAFWGGIAYLAMRLFG